MLLFGPDRVLRTRSAWVYHGRLPAPPRRSLLVLLKLLPEMDKTSAPQPQNAQTALLWLEFSLVYIAGCLMFRKKKAPHLSSLPRFPCLPVPLPLFLCLCLYFCCPEGGLVSFYVGCLSSDRAAKGLVKCLYKKKKHDSLLVAHIVVKSQWGCFLRRRHSMPELKSCTFDAAQLWGLNFDFIFIFHAGCNIVEWI